MGLIRGAKFDIRFVKIYDEDEDAVAAYFELIEKPYISHGFYDSFAEARMNC